MANIVGRIRKRMYLDPTLHAVHSRHVTDRHVFRGLELHG